MSGLVGLDGTKMSKSLGNLVFVGDLCKEWDPAAVRLALLATTTARTGTGGPATCRPRRPAWPAGAPGTGPRPPLEAVRARLDEDLDTPKALRALDEAAAAGRPVGGRTRLLGVEV